MTAPLTIRPQRTATPPQTPALVDAEILAGQLVWTLGEINRHAELTSEQELELFRAMNAACDAQHRITTLQMMEGRR